MHAEPTTFRDTPCIHLHAEGASALVALHGAHVLSWILQTAANTCSCPIAR